ncbi:MAG TPA: secretin N-terminal domain-containing protein, partial [Myxococcales bacterium]
MHQVRWPFLLPVAALLAATPSLAQTDADGRPQAQAPTPIRPIRPGVRPPTATQQQQRPAGPARPQPPATRPSPPPATRTQPAPAPAPAAPAATRATEPGEIPQVDKSEIHNNARTVMMSFDKRDLTEVIQFVSQFTQRNFILPERVSGKITILSNTPIPADDVWNVFVAALDANNWAVYPVGKYWKLTEKKQSSRSNIPVYIESGQEPPANEQMVTKLFKLHYVEADQMRNVLNQFTSRDSDFQIFPPDSLIISDVGLNMRRLEKLIEQLDQPGGSEEIHIVPVQYAGAQELAQKLTEIFQSQQPAQKGVPRQLGVAQPVQPGQPVGVPQPGMETASGGALQVGKIIPEERTNKLIVIAGGKSFDRVLDLIKQLDVPSSEG